MSRGEPICPPTLNVNVVAARGAIPLMAAMMITLICSEGTHAGVLLHGDHTMTGVDRDGSDECNVRAERQCTHRRQ